MSFGEHLEELRAALIKAIGALVVGVMVGFFCADYVVWYIQTPLQAGLQEFRSEQLKQAFDEYLDGLRESGQEVPEDLAGAFERYKKEGLVPRVWRIDPRDLAAALKTQGVETPVPADPNNEGPAASELVPLLMWSPLADDPRTRTIGTGIPDAFMVWLKAALLVGAVLASPAVFYFLWSFVATGLYPHERRYVWFFMPFSIVLFFAGVALAFFGVFPLVLNFLFNYYGSLTIDPTPRIGEWLNFALLLPIGFGAGFQLPLVMLFLERIGLFTVEQYEKSWKVGVMVIAIASMLLTPADPGSMIMLAVPMTFLYFGGMKLCRWLPREQAPLPDEA